MTALTGTEARRAARNAGAIAAARILSSGALLIWQLVLARSLGEAEFGIYGAVNALFSIGAVITSFSLSLIIIRDVARRPETAGRYLSAALVVQTVLGGVAYLAINGLALQYDTISRGFVAIAGISLLIDMVGNLSYDQLLAQERMVTTSIVEVVQIAARIGFAALLLALGWGLPGVYLATILVGIGRSVALWLALRRTGVKPVWRVDWSIARPMLINAAPLTLAAFVGITYAQADRVMSATFLTNADTGHLNAAYVMIVGVVDILNTTILVAAYPMLSRAWGSDLFRFMVEKLAYFSLLIGVGVGLVFTLFADAIIVPLFGVNYVETASILRVYIWFASITMVFNVFAQSLMVENRQRRLSAIHVVGLLIKLAVSYFLIRTYGAIGAVTASVIVEGLKLIAVGASSHLTLDYVLPRLLRLAAVVALSGAAMWVLGQVHPMLGMAGGLIYLGGVLLLLQRDEWDLLYRLASAAPGGALLTRVWKRDVNIS
ncbi:MAG: flippase [Chloroflexi bacterium]|nr:flippase [Chloroflexota bacterium]